MRTKHYIFENIYLQYLYKNSKLIKTAIYHNIIQS